jgi:nicotinamide-nucleotide amidase
MTVALLAIGSELLQGDVANTNGQWLAVQLTDLGYHISSIATVGDDGGAIAATLARLMASHDIVIVTGGLGPTSDDITSLAVAELKGVSLVLNEDALACICRRLESKGREVTDGHRKQAMLPDGATYLPNSIGTAPGYVIQYASSKAFFLPGVPSEMKQMYDLQVYPRIRAAAPNDSYQIVLHTYRAGETWLAEQLEDIEQLFKDVRLGYRARSSDVSIKITARGEDPADAREGAEKAAAEIRNRLGNFIYGEGADSIVHVASRSVRVRGWNMAVAESCTGGLIARQLTSVPASDYFVGAAVTYANSAKTRLLGVSEETLRGHGAVSAEVAAEMAEGARRQFGSDIALSVTGIAGPSGATSDKPVGLVYYAVAHPTGTEVRHEVFSGDRNQVQRRAAHAVLDLVRRICQPGSDGLETRR